MSENPLLKNLSVERVHRGRPIHAHYFHGDSFSRHSHDFLEIVIVTKNGGLHVVSGREFTMREGEVYLLGPHLNHFARSQRGQKPEHFNIEFFPEMLLGEGGSEVRETRRHILRSFYDPFHFAPIKLSEEDAHEMAALCSVLEREIKARKKKHEIIGRHLLMSMLHIVSRYTEPPKKQDHVVLECLEIIDTHFREDIVSEELAARFSMTPSRLSQVFKAMTGKTIKDIVVSRRLTAAKDDLISTTDGIQEILLRSGFNDASYFHRAFKKDTGISPKTYRSRFSQPDKDFGPRYR